MRRVMNWRTFGIFDFGEQLNAGITGLGQAGQPITTIPRKTLRTIREGMAFE